MTFEEILPGLKRGGIFTRDSWLKENVIIRQNDNTVYPDTVPKMSSLPKEAKELFHQRNMEYIRYSNQVIKLNTSTGAAKNYIPDWEDIFAVDWRYVALKETEDGHYYR